MIFQSTEINMIKSLIAASVMFTTGTAHAETFEVRMLNRGEKGAMVYEPDFLSIVPGDTVRFLSTTPGHNARTIKGMAPDGAVEIKTALGKDAEVIIETPGLYGIKCSPHFGMGMVMLIAVGTNTDPVSMNIPDDLPIRAKKRFEEIISDLD